MSATADKGERILQAIVDNLAAYVEEVRRVALGEVRRPPL